MKLAGHITLPGRGRIDYVLERDGAPELAGAERITLTVTSGRQAGMVLANFTMRRGAWIFDAEREARRRAFGATT